MMRLFRLIPIFELWSVMLCIFRVYWACRCTQPWRFQKLNSPAQTPAFDLRMISFLETLRAGDMSKERLRRSQNKLQNVRKGRSSSNEYLFSGGTLVYQAVSAGLCSALSARGSVTLRLLLEKRKHWDSPKKKSQQWTKFVKWSLKKKVWCGW